MAKISTSKVWRNIACAASTVILLWDSFKFGADPWLLLVYLATVGGFEWISAMIKQRFGTFTETTTKTATKEAI